MLAKSFSITALFHCNTKAFCKLLNIYRLCHWL